MKDEWINNSIAPVKTVNFEYVQRNEGIYKIEGVDGGRLLTVSGDAGNYVTLYVNRYVIEPVNEFMWKDKAFSKLDHKVSIFIGPFLDMPINKYEGIL